jgi:hypothetical protein
MAPEADVTARSDIAAMPKAIFMLLKSHIEWG